MLIALQVQVLDTMEVQTLEENTDILDPVAEQPIFVFLQEIGPTV